MGSNSGQRLFSQLGPGGRRKALVSLALPVVHFVSRSRFRASATRSCSSVIEDPAVGGRTAA
jgi:hypothetical protein